jgi:Carboxypeptidase regulatory-like domain
MDFGTTNSRDNQCMGRTKFCAAALFVVLGLCCHPARAQSAASVSGMLTDSQHAAVADAPFSITNLATKQTYNVQTDAQGSYEVKGLPAGEYRIDIKVSGFKTVQLRALKVGDSEAVTQDVTQPDAPVLEMVIGCHLDGSHAFCRDGDTAKRGVIA